MDRKNATTNVFFAEENNRKNKQYAQLKLSILLCSATDVICGSQEYDILTNEWYENDEDWGV